MEFTWKTPCSRNEYIDYTDNPKKVLENAFYIGYGIEIPRDVWLEIFGCLVDKYVEGDCISFLNQYFQSQCQIRKNPFVVWNSNALMGLIADPYSDAWNMRLPEIFDVDLPEILSYEGSLDRKEWRNNSKQFSVGTYDVTTNSVSKGQNSFDLYRIVDILVGFWIPHPHDVQELFLEFNGVDGRIDVDLKNPKFKMEDGCFYKLDRCVYPSMLAPFTYARIIIKHRSNPSEVGDTHKPIFLKYVGLFLDTETRMSMLSKEIYYLPGNLVISNGMIHQYQTNKF